MKPWTLVENMGGFLFNLSVGKGFLTSTQNSKTIKKKIGKFDTLKIKS